jgi:chromate transporter
MRMNDFTASAPSVAVSRTDLFVGFLKVGLSGFGGVMPFARRMLVEERSWLTEREFTEVLSLSQFLPGPNIVNVSIIVGSRFAGAIGALVASLGLMLMPFLIVLALAALYSHFDALASVRGATAAVSSAATGLIVAMGLKMARPLTTTGWQVGAATMAFAAIALLRWPLLWTLLGLAPASVAVAWWTRK